MHGNTLARLLLFALLAVYGPALSAQPADESDEAIYPDLVSPSFEGHYRSAADSIEVQQQLAALYEAMIDPTESEKVDLLLEKLLDRARASIVGGDHPDLVDLLNFYGKRRLDLGYLEQARQSLEEGVAIARRIYPGDHPAVPGVLTNLAVTLERLGDLRGAIPLHEESLAVRRRIYGPLFDGLNQSLYIGVNNLGSALYGLGETDRALELMGEGLAIARGLYPDDHPDLARAIDNLAVLYDQAGRIDSAGVLYGEALLMRQRLFEDEPHPDLLNSLSNVMLFRYERGDYLGAIIAMQNVIDLAQELYRPDHPALAALYVNCGGLASALEKVELAENLLHEAYRIATLNYEGDHPETAQILGNLGALALDRGRLDEATLYTAHAFAMSSALYGEMSTATITNRINLGAIARELELWEVAGSYLDEVWEIVNAELPATDRRRILLSNNVASHVAGLFRHWSPYLGDAERREFFDVPIAMLQEGLRMLDTAALPDPADVAITTGNLGTLYGLRGDVDSCLPLLGEAWALLRNVRSFGNLDVAELMFNIAGTYERIGRTTESLYLYRTAIEDLSDRLLESTLYESEYEQIRFFDRWDVRFDDYFGAMTRFIGVVEETPEAARDLFNFSATRKGAVRDAALLQRRIVSERAEHDADIAETWRIAREARRELARLYHAETTPSLLERIAVLENEITIADKLLARASNVYGTLTRFDYDQFVEQLSDNEAWVEFIRFRYYDRDRKTDTVWYYALVALPERQYPEVVRLATEEELALCISRSWDGENYVTDEVRNRLLHDRVWAPVSPYLDGVEQVRLSPTGLVSLISFGVLRDTNGIYLVESTDVRYMNGVRSFLDDPVSPPLSSDDHRTAALFGGVVYSLDSVTNRSVNLRTARDTEDSVYWDLEPHLSYLPGTLFEVESIESILQEADWSTTMFVDSAASERELKRVDAPTILHVATHGFFFPMTEESIDIDDPFAEFYDEEEGWNSDALIEEVDDEPEIKLPEYPYSREEELYAAAQGAGTFRSKMAAPMLGSGLYLSGADRILSGIVPPPGVEDGVVTAFEIAGLDLDGTDLVVLSACETGLGEVHGSEGVFGLPRAFQLAGADAVVMTLWPVPDDETAELMDAFYRNIVEGQTTDDALRNAQRSMSMIFPPHAWGAFILVE